MPLIQFPDVPQVPGVPPLVRSGLSSILAVTGITGTLNKLGLPTNFLTPVWGLFGASGEPVFTVESVIAFGIHNQTRVSDFPIEKGAFNSYNKVGSPYEINMTFAQGASEAARSALITRLEDTLQSTDLYTVVTPEKTYENATISNYDYRREQRAGAGMIVVDITFTEVRETAKAQFTSKNGSKNEPIPADIAASPSGASPQSIGQVQATEPTAEQTAFIEGAA